MTMYRDKVVIVTGAGLGIGFGLCQAFAGAGAMVALNDIDAALARQAAASINERVGVERVYPFPLDVADVAAVREMVDEVATRYDRLDIVIANAGLTDQGPFLDYSVEAFDRVTAVNLRGSFFTAQAAARQMIARGTENGRIILLSSVTGVQAFADLAAYGVTKAGIRHMAKALAVALGPHGITVNAIAPGATLTERTLADDPDYDAHWSGVTPTGRVGTVEDIVAAALFLCSAEARHVTGQTIVVDGGWTVKSPIPGESSTKTRMKDEG